MKFKSILTFLLSISLLASFTACSDDNSSLGEVIITETATTTADEQQEIEKMESEAAQAQKEMEEQIKAEEARSELEAKKAEETQIQKEFEELNEQEAAQAQKEIEEQIKTEEEQAQEALAEIYNDEIMADFDPEKPQDTIMKILESGFSNSYGENKEITYDEGSSTYTVSVWQEGFAVNLDETNGPDTIEQITQPFELAITEMTEQIRYVHEQANITFNLVNELDHDDILITVHNGQRTFAKTQW